MIKFDVRVLVKSYANRHETYVTAFEDDFPGKDWTSAFLLRHINLSQSMVRNMTHNHAATTEELLREFFDRFQNESEGVTQKKTYEMMINC